MKPIYFTEEAEEKVLKAFVDKFKIDWAKFVADKNKTKFSFSVDVSTVAKDRVTIIYSPKAYLRMQALVDFFDTEVSWYALVEKLADRIYRIYDVRVCKQYVNGVKVDTDDDSTREFYDSLPDDEVNHLHCQCHSHVRASTDASEVDIQNQLDILSNVGNKGFYIFQIWNKQGDINTYLYDMDDNVYYDRKDVDIEIEDDGILTLNDFLGEAASQVIEMKYQQWDKGEKTKKSDAGVNYLGSNYGQGYDYGTYGTYGAYRRDDY